MDAEPAETLGSHVVRSGGSPSDQLSGLLDRAANGARARRQLAVVRSALMHHCGLQSCRHTKGPPRRLDRRTFRHSFLLADGGVRVVWELEHNTGPGGEVEHAVFTEREDLVLAEWDVDAAFGLPQGPGEPAALPAVPEPPRRPDEEALRRAYPEADSPEHAWRLLRRAANPGAPGRDVLARLRGAIAHDISIVTRRSTLVAGRLVSWTLYEHAFLLVDGSEVSLWEIDHTRTPTGAPVCEVYRTRDAALDTAVRRIEAG
ncbi:DUF6227 family protein [Actinacidiphila rubida]|uniref:Uncharacterized protein n=1 Tax=Actinacidiphila rubida TaxID=310780 RepID=A0A1H8JVI3_9ACTN|nr:DUF6227 family protein [Actinacidiphila rubida]SEN84732.1 hypothetical protein SAMN05216267_101173 [Actinacidiphila rubida]